jgi:general secretion pathway protein E
MQPPHSLDASDFHAHLIKARDLEHADGLFTALLQTSDLPADRLEQILQASFGIRVWRDADASTWQAAQVSKRWGATGLALRLGQQARLLFLDPWSMEATQVLAQPEYLQAEVFLASTQDIAALGAALHSGAKSTPKPQAVGSVQPKRESPVVTFVDAAITQAYQEGASDIHFETDRQGIGIKFRLDGVMSVGPRLDDLQHAEEVISRIKVLAELDITERRRPQDGRIHWQHADGSSIDLRVSIMPSIFGEDAVLRLLDKAQLRDSHEGVSLELLGFEPELRDTIRALATRPHGMLLVTGPTGSGKTTTVYAALSEVNDGLEKIVTIEDPVEYELPGVLQIPVNEQKGLTFATGLRSILRHDPDKILVGEIRDAETAEIAVQSSLTGHLVFTTVHANSLFDVLGRFQHFGIDPFALVSALNGVIVQRLLRRLCPHCRAWRAPTGVERQRLEALGLSVPNQLPVAQGCEHCRQSGYKGRFVVAEVHTLNDETRDLILKRASMSDLKSNLYQATDKRLLAQALAQVAAGNTSLEEVARVVGLV